MELIEFGTIAHIKKGKKPLRQIDHAQDGYLPYVDIEAFETGNIKAYTNGEKCLLCKAGEILIVCDGSRSGYVGRAIDGYVGSTLAVISADGMSEEYLYYFLQGKYALLNTKKKGTGTPHLDQQVLFKQKLSVPSVNEQKRIVARIEELFSELDNGVETLRKTKQQLAVYRQAVLKDAFDGAMGCKTGTIHSVCSNIVDCPHSTPQWVNDGRICLRTTNFRRGYLDLSEKNYVSEETFDKRNARLVPQPGDVLYSREGAILGIACIIPDDMYVCLGQRMMLLRANEKMLGRFLMHYLNSPKVTSFVATKTGGSASPHVNVGDIKEFVVPIPPIFEQQKMIEQIESRLSVCESIEKAVDTALQQSEAMRQSILKQAFEGRLQ